VTTEAYPYTAGMTEIASAHYNDWESQPQEYFATFLWPPTGERLTRESFKRYRQQGGFVAQFTNTEEMVRLAISYPVVMIASDGILDHPSAGTYARVLGKPAFSENPRSRKIGPRGKSAYTDVRASANPRSCPASVWKRCRPTCGRRVASRLVLTPTCQFLTPTQSSTNPRFKIRANTPKGSAMSLYAALSWYATES